MHPVSLEISEVRSVSTGSAAPHHQIPPVIRSPPGKASVRFARGGGYNDGTTPRRHPSLTTPLTLPPARPGPPARPRSLVLSPLLRLSRQLNMSNGGGSSSNNDGNNASLHDRRRPPASSSSGGDEDYPSPPLVAHAARPGVGGGKLRGAGGKKAGMTVDTSGGDGGGGGGGSFRYEDASDGRGAGKRGDGGAEDRRTSSPTSVADFALSASGMGGNMFPSMPPPQQQHQQLEEEEDRQRHQHSVGQDGDNLGSTRCGAPGSSSSSGSNSSDTAAGGEVAASDGDGDGEVRNSAEFLSAQALFGGSIPGLTSFGEFYVCRT